MTTKPDFVSAWTEPESAANTNYQPVYPYNNVTQTRGGHSFEMDDTPTRERIRLQHGKGTFLEMHPDGTEVHKIIGDGYTIVLGDHNIAIGIDDGKNAKKLNITVYGDVNMHVTGNKTEQIDGNFEQVVKGAYTQTVHGISNIRSFGNMNIDAGASLLGKLTISTPDSIRVNGDLRVDGTIKGGYIASSGRVDAATGVSAGPLGFVTVLGGISVGLPAATPLQINCSGPINSLTSMTAPSGTYGVHSSLLAYDVVNEMIRKVHNHVAPLGPTSPPLQKEISG